MLLFALDKRRKRFLVSKPIVVANRPLDTFGVRGEVTLLDVVSKEVARPKGFLVLVRGRH